MHLLHCGESRILTVAVAGVRVMLGSELVSLTVSVSMGESSHTPSSNIITVMDRRRWSLEKGPRDCDKAA